MRLIAAPAVVAALVAGCTTGDDTARTVRVDTSTVTSPSITSPSVTSPSVTSTHTSPTETDSEMLRLGRVDLQPTGNRLLPGRGALASASPLTVDVEVVPIWIVPIEHQGDAWLVVGGDGSTRRIDLIGDTPTVTTLDAGIDPNAGPPIAVDGSIVSGPGAPIAADALPDGRVVRHPDADVSAELVLPTDRYAHGVLGDAIEAGGVEIRDVDAGAVTVTRITVDERDVIEAVAPMLADVDGDGDLEVVVTLANSDDGARLAVFEADGALVGESDPIGRGNRWRNLLAVGPVGPNGEIEVIDVRTPHIGGTLQFFRLRGLDDGQSVLERVARLDGYTTHEIGSRNLDLGIVSDADGDGRLDVV
ncbi:MAG: hypothetical protein AAGG08_07125, partial [Actinomycetota bacterium]